MNKWIAALSFVVVLFVTVWATRELRQPNGICKGCNLILISVDSLRVDHMSLYGYKRETTPQIDQWAKGALVFENYFSTAYLTPISEGSVHTGYYPETNGLTSFRRTLSPEVKTLAEVLKGNGYNTFAYGSSPEYVIYETLRSSFSRGFDTYAIAPSRKEVRNALPWEQIQYRLSHSVDKPFFLWLAIGDVHAPFGAGLKNQYAWESYSGPFRNLRFFANMQFYFEGWLYNIFSNDKVFEIVNWSKSNHELHNAPERLRRLKWPIQTTEQDLKYVTDMYDNGVVQVDRQIGKLLEILKELKLRGNTVIVFQSEHGESLGEYGYIAHYDIDEATIHVPLIIDSPAIKKSERVSDLVSGVDILPSLMTHLGLSESNSTSLDGKSIFDEKTGKRVDIRSEVYLTRTPLWESLLKTKEKNSPFDKFRELDDQIGFRDHGVRTRTAKLIHRTARLAEEQYSCWTYISGKKISRREFEYFDLVADTLGEKPLVPPEEHPLFKKLQEFETDMRKRSRETAPAKNLQNYQ